MNLTTIEQCSNEIDRLDKEVETVKDKMVVLFWQSLSKIFEENLKFQSFRCDINNHEFNDGDQTQFSIYYEDIYREDVNDYSDDEDDDYSHVKGQLSRNSRKELLNLLNQSQCIHEKMFGDEYESFEIDRNYIKNKLENK